MSNKAHESKAATDLATIEAQLQQFNQRLSSLTERVARSEENLILVADVYKYKKLRDFLAAGDLREADWETIQVILAVTKQPDVESITPDDMRRFPCDELRVIDSLWTTYSNLSRCGWFS
jgi:molybdopterin converting factor small subunit